MSDDEDRIEVDILGRNLGTASGWDGDPGECIWFYEFQPRDGVDLKSGDLQIDFVKGLIGIQGPEGEILDPEDAVYFLNEVKRVET